MASEFFSGLSSDLGLVSLGTFFASKESTSATPKAFKTLAATAKTIQQNIKRRASKESTSATPKAFKNARRAGEITFMKKPACAPKKPIACCKQKNF